LFVYLPFFCLGRTIKGWEVIKELFQDPRFATKMAYEFKEIRKNGKRVFGDIGGGLFMEHLQVG